MGPDQIDLDSTVKESVIIGSRQNQVMIGTFGQFHALIILVEFKVNDVPNIVRRGVLRILYQQHHQHPQDQQWGGSKVSGCTIY